MYCTTTSTATTFSTLGSDDYWEYCTSTRVAKRPEIFGFQAAFFHANKTSAMHSDVKDPIRAEVLSN